MIQLLQCIVVKPHECELKGVSRNCQVVGLLRHLLPNFVRISPKTYVHGQHQAQFAQNLK